MYAFRENKKQSILNGTIPFTARYMKICRILNSKIYF